MQITSVDRPRSSTRLCVSGRAKVWPILDNLRSSYGSGSELGDTSNPLDWAASSVARPEICQAASTAQVRRWRSSARCNPHSPSTARTSPGRNSACNPRIPRRKVCTGAGPANPFELIPDEMLTISRHHLGPDPEAEGDPRPSNTCQSLKARYDFSTCPTEEPQQSGDGFQRCWRLIRWNADSASTELYSYLPGLH